MVPLKFDGVTDLQTAAEYNLESRDIYVNLDHALKRDNENVGIAAVIGSLVHECTHAWHHQLTINPDVPKPPGWRDAEAILDFNFKNYARPGHGRPDGCTSGSRRSGMRTRRASPCNGISSNRSRAR